MSQTENKQQEVQAQAQPQQQPQSLFAGLKAEIIEHGSGDFLRLQDGESVVATVDVDLMNPDPTKRTPRLEQVDNFAKNGKVWKMHLDVQVGSTKKVYHIGVQSQREVIKLLESGVRKIKISRLGTRLGTRYFFSDAQEQ